MGIMKIRMLKVEKGDRTRWNLFSLSEEAINTYLMLRD